MSGSLKRKRDGTAAPKFYAVRTGRRPGIFSTWAECFSSVNAFPKAIYKSFATEADAQSFIQGVDVTAKAKATKHSASWYAVRNGRAPGIYANWTDAEQQSAGFKDAVYRKFSNRSEAEQYMQSTQPNGTTAIPLPHTDSINPVSKKPRIIKGRQGRPDQPSATDVDLSAFAPGDAPLPIEVEDGFDSSIILDEESGALRYRTDEENARLKPQVARPVADAPIVIFTDGSTLANGQLGAIAGVGVYFGPADKRNASETLPGKKQTNQRAELTGLMRALELAPRDRKLVIKSDSKYAIQCVTTWFLAWRRNNWQTAQKKAVDNKDLVVKVIDLLEERMRINKHRVGADTPNHGEAQHWDRGPAGVRFEWIKGHSVHEGNQAADMLAVQGARKAQELDAMTADDVDI